MSNKPKDRFVIEDLDALRVVSDPLRNQILELLILDQLTVKQVADKLGLAPSKLYYHIRQLENHGLIHIVKTRMVANLQEKYYRGVAQSYTVSPDLLSFRSIDGRSNINSVVSSTLDSTREDFMRSLEAGVLKMEQTGHAEEPRRALLTRHLARIPKEQAEAFITQLEQFIKDFEAAHQAEQETNEALLTYAFTAAFYPTLYFAEDEGNE